MKNKIILCGVAALVLIGGVAALTVQRGVSVNPSAELIWPTNFFEANSNLLNASVAPAGSVETNALFAFTTNLVEATSNNIVAEIHSDYLEKTNGVAENLTAKGGDGVFAQTWKSVSGATAGYVDDSGGLGWNMDVYFFENFFVTKTNTARWFAGDGNGLTNLNAANIASGTLPNARLGSTVVTNVMQTTNSAGVASIANNVLLLGTNVPASTGSTSGITNGGSATLNTLTLTNTLTMGRTNDSNNGVTLATIISSNALVNYNFTMAANDIGGQLHPDHVFYQGFNVGPGGGNAIAGQPTLYWGIENEWQGTSENYIHFRNFGGDISYRPYMYSVNRTNGYCQIQWKVDQWPLYVGAGYTNQVWNIDTNGVAMYAPITLNPNSWRPANAKVLSLADNAGAERTFYTNGVFVHRGVYFNSDGVAGLALSLDTTSTNNANVGLMANFFKTYGKPGTTPMTNTYQNGGVTVGTNSWSATVASDVSGVQINNGNGAYTTMLSLGVGGVADRTVIYCIGSTDNSALAGHAQYDTLIKSKKGVFFTCNDSAQNDMQISNRWAQVNGTLDVTRSATVATNIIARVHGITAVSTGPTFAQWGGATNAGFFWSSNSTPPTLYWSYFDGSSNRVDTVK